jgi:transposase-like protein
MPNKKLTIKDFFILYPDDNTCLEHIFNSRFGQDYKCPQCEKESSWYRFKAERAYACKWCGYHLHPTVGTLFEKTRTPLQLWFYAMYLFSTTRHGVSAKELQRQLGVTYKCAWRMGHEIRKHMAHVDGESPLYGQVEIDETYIGGRVDDGHMWSDNKTIVLGMKQRDGDLITKIVPNTRKETLIPIIEKYVDKDASVVYTDEHGTYTRLPHAGFKHEKVNHKQGEYVRGDVHTNNIENAWSGFKRSIKGTHIKVSKKHLEKYAKEFEYRSNSVSSEMNSSEMFDELISTYQPVAA